MKTSLYNLRKFWIIFPVIPLLFVLSEKAHACRVPVFYYALFEWPSDPHTLDLGTLVKGIKAASIKDQIDHSSANLQIDSAATSTSVPADHVQIRFSKTNQLWWDAPLPGDDPKKGLDLLMDSPVRQNIVRQLASGVSVVWVLLESGDKKADDAAFSQLANRLSYLQKVIDIPPPADNGGNDGESGPDPLNVPVPLRIAFHAVRVSRNDPKEVGLVAQLVNLMPELLSVKSPIAYPVFGRALVMQPIYGKKFNDLNIDVRTQFAAGACSCQVKDQNPGVDLLVAADWDSLFESVNKNKIRSSPEKTNSTNPVP